MMRNFLFTEVHDLESEAASSQNKKTKKKRAASDIEDVDTGMGC